MIRNQLVIELSNSTISAESLSWWLRYGNVDIYDFHNYVKRTPVNSMQGTSRKLSSLGCCYSFICRNLKYRMVASKCISHFLQFILLLLELSLATKFDMSAGSVSTLSTAKSRPITSIFRSWTFCGGAGGSKRQRPNDVVGEKIDSYVCRP